MTLGTLIYTKLFGQKVGTDPFGNTYYQGKALRSGLRHKRWVLYRGAPEASAVPPEWHAWLHHTIDAVPVDGGKPHAPWQKPHMANQTGSPGAYRPPGHTLEGGRRAKGTGDYQPWTPS